MNISSVMVVGAFLGAGCASWPYQRAEQAEVTEMIFGEEPADSERALLAEFIEANAPDELLAYPKPCRRKDCASPEVEYFNETRDATLLLSAARQLWRANERAHHEQPRAPRTRQLTELTLRRLPSLRTEIDEVLFVLLDKYHDLPRSKQLSLAIERLQVALLLCARTERFLAQQRPTLRAWQPARDDPSRDSAPISLEHRAPEADDPGHRTPYWRSHYPGSVGSSSVSL